MKKIICILFLSFSLLGGMPTGTTEVKADTLEDFMGEFDKSTPGGVLKYKQGKAEGKGTGGDVYTEGATELSFVGLLQKVTDYAALVIASVAILLIVLNGLRVTYSAGGEELNKAKTALLWSFLGLGMISFAYIIVKTAISLTYFS